VLPLKFTLILIGHIATCTRLGGGNNMYKAWKWTWRGCHWHKRTRNNRLWTMSLLTPLVQSIYAPNSFHVNISLHLTTSLLRFSYYLYFRFKFLCFSLVSLLRFLLLRLFLLLSILLTMMMTIKKKLELIDLSSCSSIVLESKAHI